MKKKPQDFSISEIRIMRLVWLEMSMPAIAQLLGNSLSKVHKIVNGIAKGICRKGIVGVAIHYEMNKEYYNDRLVRSNEVVKDFETAW